MVGVLAGLVSLSCILAEEAGDPKLREALESDIRQLQTRLVEARSAGQDPTELRGALKDIRDAQTAGDWNKVAELVAAAKRSAGAPPAAAGGSPAGAGAAPGGGAPAAFVAERATVASGDVTISLLVWKPSDTSKPCPAVALIADGFRGVGRVYREFAEALAGKGYVVVAPELRGQGRSGGKVEFLGGEVEDIKAAVAYLKTQQFVDANRITLIGAGWGGTAALLAVGRGLQVKATVALAAPTDLPELVQALPGVRHDLRTQGVDLDTSDQKLLKEKSPIMNTLSFSGECLLVYGKTDASTPESQVTGYAAVLQARGIKVTVKAYTSLGVSFVEKDPDAWRPDVLDFVDIESGKKTVAQPAPAGGAQQPGQGGGRRRGGGGGGAGGGGG
jgi:dienelactone hydrolase